MPVPNLPDSLGSLFNDLDRRLQALERGSDGNIGISNGYFRVSDGYQTRVRVGIQDDGSFGLRVWDIAGTLVHDFTA